MASGLIEDGIVNGWLAVAAGSVAIAASLAISMLRSDTPPPRGRRLRPADVRLSATRLLVDQGRVIAIDDAFAVLLGGPGEAVLGSSVMGLLPELGDLDLAAQSGLRETRLVSPHGAPRAVLASVEPPPKKGAPHAVLLRAAPSNAAGAAAAAAALDPLTQLPTLSRFVDEAAARLIEAGRVHRRMALVQVDLVRFRSINDVMGRRFGDRAIREVAERLIAAAGAGVALGRAGGDRFVLLRPAVGSSAATLRDVEALLIASTGSIETDEGMVEISGRAAVALLEPLFVGEDDDADQALAIATVEHAVSLVELAMGRAKRNSTTSVVLYDADLDQSLRDRGALALALPRALALPDKTLSIHYQPQVRLGAAHLDRTGAPRRRREDSGAAQPRFATAHELTGFEALLRCVLPGRGPVGPADLIPIAEETNAILPIGEWVLRRACADAARWSMPLRVAVNLSPVQLRHDGVVAMVADALRATGLPAGRLELEITETAMIEDIDRASSVMTALKRLGVKIAIDDFGAGFTSLRALKAFRFDKIKLDRAFVTDIGVDPMTAAIARAVVGLGAELRTPVLAEGVETLDELRALERMGCTEAQGYLIGRPAPLEAFPELRPNGVGAEAGEGADAADAPTPRLRLVTAAG